MAYPASILSPLSGRRARKQGLSPTDRRALLWRARMHQNDTFHIRPGLCKHSGNFKMRSGRMKRSRFLGLVSGLGLTAAIGASGLQAEEPTGTLKTIKESGSITLGYRDSSIPFSYLDDNQKPVGFAMDICYKIVDAVKKELKLDKLEVKLNPVTSATRIPLMANGTIDLECGSTTNNAERQKQVSFTNTHFLTASRYVFKKSSGLKSIEDLKG